jgi:integration host factor subunit alpha
MPETLDALTRAELAMEVKAATNLSRRESRALVGEIFNVLVDSLASGEHERVKLPRFGTFILHEKTSRPGRNLQTQEAMEIPARRVVLFHPSQVFLSNLNPSGNT